MCIKAAAASLRILTEALKCEKSPSPFALSALSIKDSIFF